MMNVVEKLAKHEEQAMLEIVLGKTRYHNLNINQPVNVAREAEQDPNGMAQHVSGAKLDAGKAEYDMALFSFPDALAHVDRIGKFGARKYTKGGFLEVPNGQMRYLNAGLRHLKQQLRGELYDPESKELHLAHRAWNALAELQLFLEGKGLPSEKSDK